MRLLTMWFRFPHAPVSCVESTSCSYDRSSPRTLVSVPAPPPYLRTPPVFKPVVSIDKNESDYYVITLIPLSYSDPCFVFCISLSLIILSPSSINLSDLRPTLASNLRLKI